MKQHSVLIERVVTGRQKAVLPALKAVDTGAVTKTSISQYVSYDSAGLDAVSEHIYQIYKEAIIMSPEITRMRRRQMHRQKRNLFHQVAGFDPNGPFCCG